MCSSSPKVSVVIPTYGGSHSLERAIDSVLLQNYSNFDVIVVDDNDPQTEARKRTESMIRKYEKDSRVLYIQHPFNKNGAAARNTGVKASDAKYICLLDDDDMFLQDHILYEVEYLEHNPDFKACYCWRKQRGVEICGTETGDLSGSLLDLSFTPTTPSIMIHRDCYLSLGGFDEAYRRHQDYEFLLRYFERYKIGVVNAVLLELVGNDVNNQLQGKKLYDLKISFFSEFGDKIEEIDRKSPGFKRKAYAMHFSAACKELLRHGNLILAMKLYFSHGIHGGLLFWKLLFSRCFTGLYKKLASR